MSISSGYDKFKDYHQTEDGSYKLTSRWTSTNTVELNDGSTVEEKFTEIDSKLSGKANSSHGNHVPTTQTASNKVFLRNDNTWATVTPANIGAAASSHNHAASNITSGTLSSDRLPTVPITKGGTGATDADTALANLGGAKASETIKTAFYDDAAENIGQLLDAKCHHARELNAPAVCIYGGWQNVDFGVFYAQVVNNIVQGIYVKGDTAYIVRCDNGTDTATYLKVAVQSDIDAIGAGTEITDVTQITQGGMYHSNGNVANAPTNDGVYYEYFASKNGWIVSIIARSGSDGATYVSNNGYDGTTWTNSGWTEIANKADLSNKLNNANPTYNGVLSSTTLPEANRQVINATAENRMYVGNPNLVDLVLESNGRGLSINNIATVGSEQRFTGIHIGAESNQAYIYTGNDNRNINFRYTDSNGNTAYKNIDSVVTKEMFTVSGSDLILEWL